MLGAPAVPMPTERSAALGQLVASVPEVLEAHLPQCYAEGKMPKPAQVLFVVFAAGVSHSAMERIGAGLLKIVPPNEFLDMWPITLRSDLLETVRGCNCRIYTRPPKSPWWRFYRRAV